MTDPHDDKVRTVALPTDVGDGADRVIAQENHGPGVALGGGEWPSPEVPPAEPAPGAAGGGASSGRGEATGDDDSGGFPPMRDVLEAEPVAGGSQSVPDDDGDQRWGASRLG